MEPADAMSSDTRFEAYIGTGIAHVHTNEDGVIGRRGYSLAHLLAYYRDHVQGLSDESYLAICEHASNPGKPRKLTMDDKLIQHLLAEKLVIDQQKGETKLFFGVEASILQTGELDTPGELTEHIDYTIASHHALPRRVEHNAKAISDLMRTAIDDPATTILGHPNRFIYSVPVNWEAVMEHAKDRNVAIEINLNIFPKTLLRHRILSNSVISHWNFFLKCIATTGVPVFIGSDIHLGRQLEEWCKSVSASLSPGPSQSRLSYIAEQLELAGIRSEQIINAKASTFAAWLESRR